jgi:hypothetical protein
VNIPGNAATATTALGIDLTGSSSNSVVIVLEAHVPAVSTVLGAPGATDGQSFNGGGLTNVTAATAATATNASSGGNLEAATVINVANYGAVPFVPTLTQLNGADTSAATDNWGAISNAFYVASNSPPPRLVYFPPGVYKISGTLTVPPLTSIKGAGIYHKGLGSEIAWTAASTAATNQWSMIWLPGSGALTNGIALRVPFHPYGPQYFSDFEVCGASNCLVVSGSGYQAGSISVFSDNELGFMGMNFDAQAYGGDFKLKRVAITGFKIGVNHWGNNCTYDQVNFCGNDMGLICTNSNWAPDSVYFTQCSFGKKRGGIGMWIAKAHGWVVDNSCAVSFFSLAFIAEDSNLIWRGGIHESGNNTTLNWSVVQDGTAFYITNAMDAAYATAQSFFTFAKVGSGAGRSQLTVDGGYFSDNGSVMKALVADFAAYNNSIGSSLIALAPSFETVNQHSGTYTLLIKQSAGTECRPPFYVGKTTISSVAVEWWPYWRTTSPFLFYVGRNQGLMADSPYQPAMMRQAYGSYQNTSTNVTTSLHGRLNLLVGDTNQPVGIGNGDRLTLMAATNYTSAGEPIVMVRQVILAEPGFEANNMPGTNINLSQVRMVGLAVLTNYTPENFTPISGYIKLVGSNNTLFRVSTTATNTVP